MRVLDVQRTPAAGVISQAVSVLEKGGLLIYPTETCYGAGVDSTNPKAVATLLAFKGSRGGKAISIAVADRPMALSYVSLNETADNIYSTLLPGPITVVSQSLHKVVPALESVNGTLGLRIPAYPLVLKIVKALGKPITATSANASGRKPPYSLEDFEKYNPLKSRNLVDLFLNAGSLPERLPSTVVDTTLHEPQVLRQGEISLSGKNTNAYETSSEVETQSLAASLLETNYPLLQDSPLIVALQGELGAGKTQFAKGVAQALGIRANVKSPTFTLIHEYPYGKGYFFHIDTWRLEKGQELLDLGLPEMLKPGNVIAIEWLQKVKLVLDEFRSKYPILWVTIENLGSSKRIIKAELSKP